MIPDMREAVERLARARTDLGLSVTELWWRYFALGGLTTALELEAVLYHALLPSIEDYDLLALALNERCSEVGGDHPFPYSTDDAGA